jgi:endonuclease/exonuclease/phosphatase family metal-dependent hydrolase
VVVKQREFEFEAPTATQDVRLTMYDVILKRSGSKVKTGAKKSGNYKEFFKVPTQAGLANVRRGWTSVDAKINGRSFRFVNTHLEAYSGDIGKAQISQLLKKGGPLASSKKPAILLGDFNSDPTDKTDGGGAYRALVSAKFTDVFAKPMQTFGQNELLTNAKPVTNTSIDHIVYRPKKSFKVKNRKVIGTKPFQAKAPRWSSDHFGVQATLRVR